MLAGGVAARAAEHRLASAILPQSAPIAVQVFAILLNFAPRKVLVRLNELLLYLAFSAARRKRLLDAAHAATLAVQVDVLQELPATVELARLVDNADEARDEEEDPLERGDLDAQASVMLMTVQRPNDLFDEAEEARKECLGVDTAQ